MQNKAFIFWLTLLFVSIVPQRSFAQIWNPGYSVGTNTGKDHYSYSQTPDPLVEINPPILGSATMIYLWEYSLTPTGTFQAVPTVVSPNLPYALGGNTLTSLTLSASLTQTAYFRRRTSVAVAILLGHTPTLTITSNVVKISVVSVNWEDYNYIREHAVLTSGITNFQAVDQLAIGPKLQTTTYLDGLGRSIEKVTRETAIPAPGNTLWGDMVEFSHYDPVTGRETQKFLPYTTSTQSGKFKTSPLTEQPAYYTNTYNETSAFSSITFFDDPLNRAKLVKESGNKWAASTGNSLIYDVNTLTDNVQQWTVDYIQGDAPVNHGAYPAGSMEKTIYTDVNQAQVVEYRNKAGQLILKKVQLDNVPTAAHAGWICTYSVYDDFGLLRYQLQPEAVKYLDANSWSFAGTAGQQVLDGMCFQYFYDAKGRTVWKKAPDAAPLKMLYDIRDRVVFMQDGNQAGLLTPQWTGKLYDELDRPVITTLYNTSASIASLQTDIDNSVTFTTVNVPAHVPPTSVDLSYDHRDINIPRYVASNSISFISDGGGSFQSGTNDQFIAEIDPLPGSPAYSGSVVTLNNPISPANMANASVTTILKYLYYDNYAFTGVKGFDNNFTNASAYSNSDPNVLPIVSSLRTINMPTGSQTRVLGTNIFLNATHYYDEKGRPIQILEDNIKSGVDITTLQYHFTGRLLSSCSSHSAPGTGYTGFVTLNKYIFDRLGRVVSLQKQVGSNAFKTVSSYDYDDMGRVKTKHLDPGYTAGGNADLESFEYSFNIHNQITGINKDYALKTPANYNKWGHFFGLYLGYDNRDNAFATTQLNGQVGAQLWNTQGDDAQRKYEYSYDNAGRLMNAVFQEQQHPGDGYSNTKMDFSITGSSGQITYDLNGNLLTMLQKGVTPGTATPITIDDLHYAYGAHSNKLQSVTDQMTSTTVNGQFGDFKDGANGAAADYVFDANGNLVVDLNKNVQSLNNGVAGTPGISYNFLDKPDQVRIVGKGTIKIVYSADGEKLQRVFIPESGGVSTITTYINEYVYQETATLTLSSAAPFSGTGGLSYINFEEGRIRVVTPTTLPGLDALSENGNITLPNSKSGAWDYFVMDYQKNVRMILTEETHSASNTCTMETTTGRPTVEDAIFGQTGGSNEVEATRVSTPVGWQSVNTTASVSALGNLAGHTIGPNTLQKVMAGDQVTATVQYYFQGSITNNNPNIIPNILNSLAGALGGSSTAGTLVHGNATPITGNLGSTTGFINAVEPSNSTGATPQAYLTILFFDERFNLISAADGGVAQQQVQSTWTTSTPPLGLPNYKAPKNGYVYVYVSNRSDQSVYFDNLAVGITAGNIIEENHYYAYGLKIAGISSKKLGDVGEGNLKNNYLYNNKEFFDDGDLNWLDYGFRNYDPQIGRFVQLDPLTDGYPYLTPYQYAGCDPITNTDMDGLESVNSVGGVARDFSYSYRAVDAFKSFIGPGVHAAVTTANTATDIVKGVSTLNQIFSITSIAIKTSVTAANIINNNFTTFPSGLADGGGDKGKPGSNQEPGLFLRYAGTNYVPLGGDVTSFHNSDQNYRNLWPFGTGTLDEPAANAEIGWAFKGKNGHQWQAGAAWYHMKADPVGGVYLDNGYTQVGPFVGREYELFPIAKKFMFSINTTLAVGAMMSKPRVADGVSGTVQGYTRDGSYKIVGGGLTLGIFPTLRLGKWISIFGGYSLHASMTKPLNIIGGSLPGPGSISTVAGSFTIGARGNINF